MISNKSYVTVMNSLSLLTPFASLHNNSVDKAKSSDQNIDEWKKGWLLQLFVDLFYNNLWDHCQYLGNTYLLTCYNMLG